MIAKLERSLTELIESHVKETNIMIKKSSALHICVRSALILKNIIATARTYFLPNSKLNYWQVSNEVNNFLRCPTSNCLGDRDFDRNFTDRDCLCCFLPNSKHGELIFSFNPNVTAIGICKYGYKGALSARPAMGNLKNINALTAPFLGHMQSNPSSCLLSLSSSYTLIGRR